MKHEIIPNFSDSDRLLLLKGYTFVVNKSKSAYSRSHSINATALNQWLARYGVSYLSSF